MIFQNSKDFAPEFLTDKPLTDDSSTRDLELALRVCGRIAKAATILENRTKTPKYKINNEYDVQDLLHAALVAYFQAPVCENPLPKRGGKSSRADITIEKLGLLIEIKDASKTTKAKLGDDFAKDVQLYSKWDHLKDFVYLVYDSSKIANVEELLDHCGPMQINEREFTVHVILA